LSIIYKERFKVRVQEIDHNKKLQAPELVRMMQEASMQHTIALKASVWDLEAEQVSWVLVKKELHFERFPEWGEEITVETYPSGLDRFLTYRDYKVRDAEGKPIATAATTWTLMHTAERRIVRIPERFNALVTDIPGTLPRPFDKLHIPDGPSIQSESFKIGYFHLDWNGHTNNVHFIRFMLESLPDDVLFGKRLRSIRIQFKQEALLHDQVESSVTHAGHNQYFHRISRASDGKDIAIAMSEWV
jgi:medium-chain acyl-[acyl-carrier-protein] hydrolase